MIDWFFFYKVLGCAITRGKMYRTSNIAPEGNQTWDLILAVESASTQLQSSKILKLYLL